MTEYKQLTAGGTCRVPLIVGRPQILTSWLTLGSPGSPDGMFTAGMSANVTHLSQEITFHNRPNL